MTHRLPPQSVLHVGRPNVGSRGKFTERVNDILDRRWLTNGGCYIDQFERRIAELARVEHCIAVCNATMGLVIAIRCLGLKGEVIVPSFTFIATAHALQWQGIRPVFCDVDPLTHNLDPRKVEELITPQTSGVIGVHLWGRPSDIDALTGITAGNGLKLLFDSAHAFGCSYKGRMIGGFGNAEVFSFHATKFINSFEGGAVVTSDAELAGKIRSMQNYGFSSYDKTDFVGTNGKMNEISAAMGLTNLESMGDFIAVNQRNYAQYREELAGIKGVSLLAYPEDEKCNYQYVVLEISDRANVTRDELMAILHKENILARRYFYPGCHRMEPYLTYSSGSGVRLPDTENLARSVLCLPTGTGVSEAEISRVCKIIRLAMDEVAETRSRVHAKTIRQVLMTSFDPVQRLNHSD